MFEGPDCDSLAYLASFCSEITSQAAWDALQFGVCRYYPDEEPPRAEMATTDSIQHATEQDCLDAGCTYP